MVVVFYIGRSSRGGAIQSRGEVNGAGENRGYKRKRAIVDIEK
jgi:hypothetical protein